MRMVGTVGTLTMARMMNSMRAVIGNRDKGSENPPNCAPTSLGSHNRVGVGFSFSETEAQ